MVMAAASWLIIHRFPFSLLHWPWAIYISSPPFSDEFCKETEKIIEHKKKLVRKGGQNWSQQEK